MSSLIQQEPKRDVATKRDDTAMVFTPRVDLLETDNELLLFADMPGVDPNDLDIRFENQELTIHGKVQPRHPDGEYAYREYGVGDFYRAFTIGNTIKAEEISAELHGGVLKVHLPKVETARPRRIEVKTS